MPLTHETFKPYQLALEFVTHASSLTAACPKGHSELSAQLRRAAISIPLNIAEGTGRVSYGDRRRFYHIARGSALECAAIIDVLLRIGAMPVEQAIASKELLVEIVKILSRVCSVKSGERREETEQGGEKEKE